VRNPGAVLTSGLDSERFLEPQWANCSTMLAEIE
jgi:hypothetical protein